MIHLKRLPPTFTLKNQLVLLHAQCTDARSEDIVVRWLVASLCYAMDIVQGTAEDVRAAKDTVLL